MELRPLLTFEKEMQGMFDRVFGRELSTIPFRPTMDVVSEGDALVATFEIPGIVPEEDVEISVEDDILIVAGQKTRETVEEKDRHSGHVQGGDPLATPVLYEREFGSFERRIPLPEGADVDAIAATYEKGLLTVRVPVHAVEPAVVRKIPVSTG